MDQDKEIISLAKEIIDNAESKSTSVESLVHKAYRLASMVNDEYYKSWFNLEKYGYSDKEPDLSYMKYTGRTFNEITKMGYWGSISTQENNINATLEELDVVKKFQPNGNYAMLQFSGQQQQVKNLNATLATYRQICSRVRSIVEDFATRVYYAYRFGQQAELILEQYRKNTLEKMLKHFPDLEHSLKIIDKNSTDTNPRGISAAASEIRNIFINLSSRLYVSKSKKYTFRDGETVEVVNEKNKLLAYVDARMGSSNEDRARRKKLFGIIHEVFTIGGKSKRELDRNELSTIFIDTFVFLNEIITYTSLKPLDDIDSK